MAPFTIQIPMPSPGMSVSLLTSRQVRTSKLFISKSFDGIRCCRFQCLVTDHEEDDKHTDNESYQDSNHVEIDMVCVISKPLVYKVNRDWQGDHCRDYQKCDELFCNRKQDAAHGSTENFPDTNFLDASLNHKQRHPEQTETCDKDRKTGEVTYHVCKLEVASIHVVNPVAEELVIQLLSAVELLEIAKCCSEIISQHDLIDPSQNSLPCVMTLQMFFDKFFRMSNHFFGLRH